MGSIEVIFLFLAILGWLFALFFGILFFRKRWLERRSRKRLEAYTAYLAQAREILPKTKTDPRQIYSITFDFMSNALSGGEEESRLAAEKFHVDVAAFMQQMTEPLTALSRALSQLKRNSSSPIQHKIKELERLILDSSNELDMVLKSLSTSENVGEEINKLQTLGYGRRAQFMDDLHREMKQLMQQEIRVVCGDQFAKIKAFEEQLNQ